MRTRTRRLDNWMMTQWRDDNHNNSSSNNGNNGSTVRLDNHSTTRKEKRPNDYNEVEGAQQQ
jgi:hypothetical protein